LPFTYKEVGATGSDLVVILRCPCNGLLSLAA